MIAVDKKWDIRDLSDERRAAKTWLPQSDKDVTEGRVVLRQYKGAPAIGIKDLVPIYQKYPACRKHGAMNAVNTEGTLWRCSECGVGCQFFGYC